MMSVNRNILIMGAVLLLTVGFFGGSLFQNINPDSLLGNQESKLQNQGTDTTSPYAGQEVRGIKSLSEEDVKALLAGEGTPFGGMAKLAELNGYPGPRHVLDMAQEIELTSNQESEIDKLYEEMKSQAITLGGKIIDLEQEMNERFADETITPDELEAKLAESAEIYGQLRFVHLKYHFLTKDILSPEQVQKYNELRGYVGDGDPCDNIPEGHDPDLWKMHNGCE